MKPSRALPAEARHSRCVVMLSGLLLLGSAGVSEAAGRGREETYPIQGMAPRERIGGLVSIPGSPLPALPRESVKDAIAIYEPLLAGLRIVLGKTPTLARGLGYLAGLYVSVGDVSKADSLYGEAKVILEEKGDSKDLGWVHNNQGLARLDQERYADAASSFRSAVDALRPDGPGLLEPRAIALQNLASAYQFLGDAQASESSYLEALSLLRQLRREGDPKYQTTRHNLAALYGSMGDFESARKIEEELLAQGLRGSLKLAVLNDLGLALRDLKELAAAEARLKEALALTTQGSQERALVLTNLAVTHRDAGDLDKAEREGEEALRLAEQLYGPESSSAAAVVATLGGIALAREDLARAERFLSRARTTLSRAAIAESRSARRIEPCVGADRSSAGSAKAGPCPESRRSRSGG